MRVCTLRSRLPCDCVLVVWAALDITTELDRNRQTLLSARQKVCAGWEGEDGECATVSVCVCPCAQVGHVTGVADQARRILNAMARREVRIKIMTAFFILLILAIIAIVIYYISKKK